MGIGLSVYILNRLPGCYALAFLGSINFIGAVRQLMPVRRTALLVVDALRRHVVIPQRQSLITRRLDLVQQALKEKLGVAQKYAYMPLETANMIQLLKLEVSRNTGSAVCNLIEVHTNEAPP